jgi:hypothetical protein
MEGISASAPVVIPSERSESRDLDLRPECRSLDSALRASLGMTEAPRCYARMTGRSRCALRPG